MGAPSEAELQQYPHIIMASKQDWNPGLVKLPGITNAEKAEIESKNVWCVQTMAQTIMDRTISSGDPEALLYNIDGFQERVISSARITSSDLDVRVQMIKFKDSLPPVVAPGPLEEMDIQAPYTFLSED